ncbi:mpv17-like protein 2 [Tubulanus polymorphus]|uniref:mpv17-like protein 2 n=1 Tax=Tubulanus polymorphus TaxID=672921 RepID=UPI003DA480FA
MFSTLKNITGRLLGRYLIVTNVVSGCSLVTAGDIFNQLVIERRKKQNSNTPALPPSAGIENKQSLIDYDRTRRMFTLGVGMGFANHGWYSFLDHVLVGKSGKIVFKKVFLDQTIAGPFFAFLYLVGSAFLEGKQWDEAWDGFKKKILVVYLVDLCFWPAAQSLNFFYIPDYFRVIYVSICGFIWCIFLSYMHHRDKHQSNAVEKTE